MKKISNLFVAALVLAITFSCGSSSSEKKSNSDEASKEKPEVEEVSTPDSVMLSIEGNDLMQYNTDKLEVIEGQIVTLTLKHVGKMSVDAMGHNWVLLAAGTDVPAFGTAAVSAKTTGYIPEDMKEMVIANTQTIGGGEETSVTFTAPSAGYYTFICSFPGHYGVMQGSFVSNPR
jgi:azurin